MKEKKLFKLINIIMNAFVYMFLGISLILLIFAIASKKDDDGAINIFNYQLRIVISPSMEKNEETYNQIKNYDIKDIKTKSLVVVKTLSKENVNKWYESLNIGDVITFRYTYDNKQETITHRIIEKKLNDSGNGYIVKLQGDNKPVEGEALIQVIDTSEENSTNYIIGKVISKSYFIGLIIYSLKKPLGIALLIIVPSVIIIIFEVIKIVNIINEERKKNNLDEKNKQLNEIEELKKKIADLESLKNS